MVFTIWIIWGIFFWFFFLFPPFPIFLFPPFPPFSFLHSLLLLFLLPLPLFCFIVLELGLVPPLPECLTHGAGKTVPPTIWRFGDWSAMMCPGSVLPQEQTPLVHWFDTTHTFKFGCKHCSHRIYSRTSNLDCPSMMTSVQGANHTHLLSLGRAGKKVRPSCHIDNLTC